MGPRSEERGDITDEIGTGPAQFALQWGRAPEGAEMPSWWVTASMLSFLQWGRAPEGAEIGLSR
jgi:hypothetical protein